MKKIYLLILTLLPTLYLTAQEQGERYNQYGQTVNRQILTPEERNGILVLESKNQSYKFWLDNRVQVDGGLFWGDAEKLNKIGNGVAFRRVRMAVKAQINKYWYGEIDVNLANGALELEDAYMKFTPWTFLDFKLGNFKENFSMENTTTSRYLTFIERPMIISAMIPSRHLGFQANYENCYFLLQGGVFFQEIKDLEIATIVEDNNKDYGFHQGRSFTGRLVIQPYLAADWGIHVGYAFSQRTPKTDVVVGSNQTVRYSARAGTSINRKKYLDTDDIPNVKSSLLQGAELAAYWGPAKVQAEYFFNGVKRNNGLKKLNFNGGYGYAAVLLFGGRQVYNKSEGEFTQPTRGRNWGDIEVGVRYEYASLNSREVMGGEADMITFGINYYINSNVKIMANINMIDNDRYANGKGKLYVGHDAAGNLTKNPQLVSEAKGKAGNDFTSLTFRFEIDF